MHESPHQLGSAVGDLTDHDARVVVADQDHPAQVLDYQQIEYVLHVLLEIELGITGGEEDGVDNTDADESDLYSKPEEIGYAYGC